MDCPGVEGEESEASAVAPEQEPWRQHAEYEGSVRVMAWSGIGKASVVWCPRYGVIYQVGSVPCSCESL